MHVTNNMSTYIQNREHGYVIYIHQGQWTFAYSGGLPHCTVSKKNGHSHILSNSNNLFVNLGHQEDISFLSTSNAISLRLVNGSVKGGLYCNS